MGEERDLGSRVGLRRVGVEGLAPSGTLGVIDRAEVEYLTLRDAPVGPPFVFDHTPTGVLLAILLPKLGTQKHIGPRSYTRSE